MRVGTVLPVATTSLPPETVAAAGKAAREFEAMALSEMLRPMFETTHTGEGLLGGGDGEAQFRPMLVSELAKAVARQGGVGIAGPVLAGILRLQETARGGGR